MTETGKLRTFTFQGTPVCIRASRYLSPRDRIAVELWDLEDGQPLSPFVRLTVNLPDERIPTGCFFVPLYSEHKEFAEEALRSGWFVDTGLRRYVGPYRSEVAIWTFAPECQSCGVQPALLAKDGGHHDEPIYCAACFASRREEP